MAATTFRRYRIPKVPHSEGTTFLTFSPGSNLIDASLPTTGPLSHDLVTCDLFSIVVSVAFLNLTLKFGSHFLAGCPYQVPFQLPSRRPFLMLFQHRSHILLFPCGLCLVRYDHCRHCCHVLLFPDGLRLAFSFAARYILPCGASLAHLSPSGLLPIALITSQV